MPNILQQRQQSTPTECKLHEGKRGLLRMALGVGLDRLFVSNQNQASRRKRREVRNLHLQDISEIGLLRLALRTIVFCGLCVVAQAQTVVLSSAAGGATVTGPTPLPVLTWHTGFGAVNGLGIGTPSAGIQKLPATGGEMYYTPFTITLAGANSGHPGEVRAYISAPFSTSSNVIQIMTCPSPGPCTAASAFTALANNQAGEVVVLPSTATNGNYTAYIGLFIANTNGFAITNNDSATVALNVYDAKRNQLNQTVALKLDLPTTTVQTAVQLQLASAPSGLPVIATGGTPDYTANFGTVNGLGIGPGAGLRIVSGQAPGGIIYSTPYLIQPAFSGFSTANNTRITLYVSTDFVHSTVLKLYDSQNQLAGYGAISKNSASPTQITGNAGNGIALTEYLGLFVSNLSGPTSFRGADNATLTYTITVQ